MNTLDELIQSINETKETYNETKARLIHLMKGKVSDLSMIPELYNEYLHIAERYKFNNDERSGNRKQFLLVILALYNPGALLGAKLSKDLRMTVKDTFGHKSNTLIYEIRKLALAWFDTYPSFKRESNIAYSELLQYIDNKKH